MKVKWLWKRSIHKKIVHTCSKTSIVREAIVVLAEKVMNKFGHDISSKLLSSWRLLKLAN